jgi:DNA-binding response OmpR family regulator
MSSERPSPRSTPMSTPPTASILLVEDDLRLAGLVSRYLENNGFRVSAVGAAEGALERVQRDQPDLVILDIGLPGEDGFSLCRRLRPAYQQPILILTARDNDIDHVLGLELGADDYVVKPIEPRVLLARVGALLRRARSHPAPAAKVMRFGGLVINVTAHSVTLNGTAVKLSSSEFDLLAHLAAHCDQIQSRETLFRALYRREYDGVDRMLDINISRLRRKLGGEAENAERIRTIWGQGYLFVADAW